MLKNRWIAASLVGIVLVAGVAMTPATANDRRRCRTPYATRYVPRYYTVPAYRGHYGVRYYRPSFGIHLDFGGFGHGHHGGWYYGGHHGWHHGGHHGWHH